MARYHFMGCGDGLYRLVVCVGFAEKKPDLEETMILAASQFPALAAMLSMDRLFYLGAVKVKPEPNVGSVIYTDRGESK